MYLRIHVFLSNFNILFFNYSCASKQHELFIEIFYSHCNSTVTFKCVPSLSKSSYFFPHCCLWCAF